MSFNEQNIDNFPFDEFTAAEIFAFRRDAVANGDNEFVIACEEAIKINNYIHTVDVPEGWESYPSKKG